MESQLPSGPYNKIRRGDHSKLPDAEDSGGTFPIRAGNQPSPDQAIQALEQRIAILEQKLAHPTLISGDTILSIPGDLNRGFVIKPGLVKIQGCDEKGSIVMMEVIGRIISITAPA